MEFHPYQHDDAPEVLARSTLVIPAVSVGNVPQLAVDLLAHTYGATLLGRLSCSSVLPVVGPAEPSAAQTQAPKISTSLELLYLPAHDAVLLQQRSPPARGRSADFATELVAWAKSRVARIVLMTSVSKAGRKDPQMADGDVCFRWMATSAAAKMGDWLGRLQWSPVEDAGELGWRKELDDDTRNPEDTTMPSFLPSMRPRSFVRTVLKLCEEHDLVLLGVVMFVHEGDNALDAAEMARAAARLLGIVEAGADVRREEWKAPASWSKVMGPGFRDMLY